MTTVGATPTSPQPRAGRRSKLAEIDLKSVATKVAPDWASKHDRLLANGEAILDTVVRGGAKSRVQAADPTRAGTYPGVPDEAAAQKAAARAIADIDWSKPRVGLWVPGTTNRGVNEQFARSLGPDTSTVAIDYPANFDLPNGVSTAMRITELVASEAKRRGKDVVGGGHSQGAWAMGEAMRHPQIAPLIDKAVLYGRPAVANARFDANDPKVRDLAYADDPFSTMTADTRGISALGNLLTGNGGMEDAKVALQELLRNPQIIDHAAGSRRIDGSSRHAYDYGSESAWLTT